MFFSKAPELSFIDLIDEGRIKRIKKNEWKCGKYLLMQLNDNETSEVAKKEVSKKLSEKKDLHNIRVFRKFVVVEAGENSSKCLMVKTYDNQATTHPNAKHLQWLHGIIWSGKEPGPLPREKSLCDTALRVKILPKTKHISKFARINYGEVFEVSHDREVYILGDLDPKSVPWLKHYYKKIQKQIEPGNTASAQPPKVPEPANDPKPATAQIPATASKPVATVMSVAAPNPAKIPTPTQAIELTNPLKKARPVPGIARIPHHDEPLGLISPPRRTEAAKRRIYMYPSRESRRNWPALTLFDTGASFNLVTERFARAMHARIAPCRPFTIQGIGTRRVTLYTKCRWQMGHRADDEMHEDDFFINSGALGELDGIIGIQALTKNRLIKWYI